MTSSLSVREVARRWKIAPARVRLMINRGHLSAIDLSKFGGRKQLRILPESVAEAEQRLAVKTPAKVLRRRLERLDPEIEAMLADD